MRAKRSIYMVGLKRGEPSPLARESDEEKPPAEKAKDTDKEKDKEKDKDKEKVKPKTEPVAIDFDGIDNRVLALPLPAGNYSNLQAGAAGSIYYLDRKEGSPAPGAPGGATLMRFDLAKR